MIYDNILIFTSYGYKFITPIELKNESSQIFPIIAEKITECEGIKVCYRILIYDTSLNIHFESVSILGHKYGYVSPLYHQQLKDNIGSVIKQFESYTQDNITNNLSYFKYDKNIIKLFTNDTYEGLKLYTESLIASDKLKESLIERDNSIDDRISNTTNDRIEEKKLIDEININIQDLRFGSERRFGLKPTVSVISENDSKEDLKKQPAINGLNVLEPRINKDKLLNVDRDKIWKRI